MPAHKLKDRHRFRRAIELTFFSVAVLVCASIALPAQEEPADDSSEAIRLFNLGQDFHEKGELIKAIKSYEAALKVIPEFPEAELQRGSALLALGRLDEAEAAYRLAVRHRDDWTLALAALGSVLIERENYDEAEKLLKKAIRLDDLSFPAYASLTDLLLRTKAPEERLRELLGSIATLTSKAKPTAGIWSARAALEHSLGDAALARTSVDRALAIDSKNLPALSEAASIALTEKDPDRAQQYVTRFEAAGGSKSNLNLLKARVAIARDMPEEALQLLASVEPQTNETRQLAATIKEAMVTDPVELEKRLEAVPADAVVLGKLCSAYRVSAPAKALEYCQRASQAEPNNIDHAIGFGAALIQAKRYEDAAGLLANLVGHAPDNFTARTSLATALFQAKRYQEAKKEFRWVVDRQPDLTAAYYFLAVTHDNLAEYADAMANYQEYLRRADQLKNREEIDRINLRLPILDRQIRSRKGRNDE